MNDFANLAQMARDAVNAGALPIMFVFYGGALAIGFIGAKIGFALSRWIGISGTIGALVYLYHLADWSGGSSFLWHILLHGLRLDACCFFGYTTLIKSVR